MNTLDNKSNQYLMNKLESKVHKINNAYAKSAKDIDEK